MEHNTGPVALTLLPPGLNQAPTWRLDLPGALQREVLREGGQSKPDSVSEGAMLSPFALNAQLFFGAAYGTLALL